LYNQSSRNRYVAELDGCNQSLAHRKYEQLTRSNLGAVLLDISSVEPSRGSETSTGQTELTAAFVACLTFETYHPKHEQ
jgi:hypothetical protein